MESSPQPRSGTLSSSTSEGISCTSETEYHISLSLPKKKTRPNYAKTSDGLLKDRADVEKEPKKKKTRGQEYLRKQE